MLNLVEWIAAKFRNHGRAKCGGYMHSVTVKVYDNGRRVFDREVAFIESNDSKCFRLSDIFLAQQVNSYFAEYYGQMRKRMKERAREIARGNR